MSGLAALLAGHNQPDIYRWHNAAHVPDVQHAVEHAGWRFVYLDGWTVEDQASFLKATAAAFELPDRSASDFDALSGSLGEVAPDDRRGIVMLWDGWAPFARADEQAFSEALRCVAGRAGAEAGRFAVLLRGDGPPLDVPELPDAHR
jgi:hypothetical protein